MKYLSIILFFVGFGLNGLAQVPKWINYSLRQAVYPETRYFTGFTSQYYDKDTDVIELQDVILENARARLSENIKVFVESKVSQETFNFNSLTREEFKKVSTSYSAIELSGLKTEVYVDNKRREVYAFAYVQKRKVSEYYSNLLDGLLVKIKQGIQLAENFSKGESRPEAFRIYSSLLTTFRDIEEAQTILLIAGIDNPDELRKIESDNLSLAVSKRIADIRNNRNLTLGEVVEFLVSGLKVQIPDSIREVVVGHLLFKETTMASSFSSHFKTLFLQRVTQEGFTPIHIEDYNKKRPVYDFLFTGNYWVEKEDLNLIVNLYQLKNGQRRKILASNEASVAIATIKNMGYEYEPKNFEEAYKKQGQFSQGDVVDGGMEVELWTNKGDVGLVYREGEALKISIKVNRPSYLRLINYWADGTKIALLDNYYIDETKVNRVYELPFEWEAACPCGVEFLQLNAQSEEFNPLNIQKNDGFIYVLDNLEDILDKNRGFKNKVAKSSDYMAEKRVVVTTLSQEF